MSAEVDFAPVAALLGDPARAAMVLALMDGRALPAGELARIAGITAPTGTSHLKKLVGGGLLCAVRQGRHRYYRLSSVKIARAVEAFSAIAPPPKMRSLTQSVRVKRLAFARTCYDHLAGELSVRIADTLTSAGLLQRRGDGFVVTVAGSAAFSRLEIAADEGSVVRACIDWTQRRHHVAGSLGRQILALLLDRGFVEPTNDRALTLTVAGEKALPALFLTFSSADIAYIEREFTELRDLCARTGRSYETALHEIQRGVRPAAAYVVPVGRHFVAHDYFEHATEQTDFARRYRAECERLMVPVDDADVAETWETYLTGVYSVCLRRLTPEAIAQKQHHMDAIENGTDESVVRQHVDALDALERPFCDFDRAFFGRPVSRDTHITAVRARLGVPA